MRVFAFLVLSLSVLSCSVDDSASVLLAYIDDGTCPNAPDIEFDGQLWWSRSAIFESWALAGGMSGTFTVVGEVGSFVGKDDRVIEYQRLDASGFRDQACSLGYAPG